MKTSASIFSLESWEKAGEFSLICKLFLENQSLRRRVYVDARTALGGEFIGRLQTPERSVTDLEGCFQYFKRGFGFKKEQKNICKGDLSPMKCCLKPSMNIWFFIVPLSLHDAWSSAVLTSDQQQSGILERRGQRAQEPHGLTVRETCNIGFFPLKYT